MTSLVVDSGVIVLNPEFVELAWLYRNDPCRLWFGAISHNNRVSESPDHCCTSFALLGSPLMMLNVCCMLSDSEYHSLPFLIAPENENRG